VNNPYKFDNLSQLNEHKESALGNIIADSYRWAVEQVEGDDGERVDFALTANGVIRETLPTGDVTMSDVYNISSLGIGPDGIAGYPLVSVYITGADLKNAFEVDASVTAIMPAAQLYFTGATSTFNPNRMLFNKVTDCGLILDNGEIEPIEDDRLYRVVTGLYCGQMLGAVNDKSFGILSITPRDAEGNVITDIEQHIIHDANGNEIKEWYALTAYLQHLGTVPAEYSQPQGYKNVIPSWNPIDLVKNANWITLVVIVVILLLITGIVFLVRGIVRRRRRKKAAKA